MQNKQIIVLGLLATVALLALVQRGAQAGPVGNMLSNFFEERRVTRCPVPGSEHSYEGKITIKVANFPKEPCKEQCESAGLESIVGSEQISFGPKLTCCCKPKESAGQ